MQPGQAKRNGIADIGLHVAGDFGRLGFFQKLKQDGMAQRQRAGAFGPGGERYQSYLVGGPTLELFAVRGFTSFDKKPKRLLDCLQTADGLALLSASSFFMGSCSGSIASYNSTHESILANWHWLANA